MSEKLEQFIYDESNGLWYELGEHDLYYPMIKFPDPPRKPLGKYARMRKQYLKDHKKALYTHWLLSEQLNEHLVQVDEQAQHLLDTMIPKLKAAQGVTDEMKMKEQMKWVGMMNNIRAQVEEIIFDSLVYV